MSHRQIASDCQHAMQFGNRNWVSNIAGVQQWPLSNSYCENDDTTTARVPSFPHVSRRRPFHPLSHERVCFLTSRLMNNQIKVEERLLRKKKRKRGQKRCGYYEKRITIGSCITSLRCTQFSRNERVLGNPMQKCLERNSKSSIH